MRKFLHNNGLSIVLLVLFIITLSFQFFTGYNMYNNERREGGLSEVTKGEYMHTGHFLEATFENWESEFLQMAVFVVLTIFLYQKGSSESKKSDEKEEVDREPSAKRAGAPWAVRKGGLVLKVYKYSLTIVLVLLFIISFIIHLYGSLKDENEKLMRHGEQPIRWTQYVKGSRFWFESFQNWQSEFFSVFALIVLSIYLRQQGSSQSKPVDAAHNQTGGG